MHDDSTTYAVPLHIARASALAISNNGKFDETVAQVGGENLSITDIS